MATIFIDQQSYDVDPDNNLLAACLTLGFNLPYFCWHPAMGSVGACRQCAVKQFKDEKDQEGRLVMACLTPASEGTRISIEDKEAQTFRSRVIEWLMLNHPHDCPVCDEGGECHLQDMTVMTGHTTRRYRGTKRTYRNQDLGPFIFHEMNRCIQCYRCVRFYRDVAGGRDLNVFGSRDRLYFGRYEDGTLENEFSGNLVEVCPTGVFTDNTLRHHYTRKWDLQMAPSICPHCSLGCNTTTGERQGMLRRIVNRFNAQVNGYFLCDRGRFGYGFVNHPQRLTHVSLQNTVSKPLEHSTRDTLLPVLSSLLSRPDRMIGIGSPRASLESNFALQTLVGHDNFFTGVSMTESSLVSRIIHILREGPVASATIQQVEQADAVFVLGEDLLHTAPRLFLALRQSVRQQPMELADALQIPRWHDAAVREAIQDKKGPLYVANLQRSDLDALATWTYHAHPDDMARLGFAVAHALNSNVPPVPDFSPSLLTRAQEIATALCSAKHPLIISGTSSMNMAVIESAANIGWALHQQDCDVNLCFTVPECNSVGVALIGGHELEKAIHLVEHNKIDTVLILENDLYRRADSAKIDQLLTTIPNVLVFDHLPTPTTAKAHGIFPVSTFAETTGTLVNNEGRAQRYYQTYFPQDEIQASWEWMRDLAKSRGVHPSPVGEWLTLDDVLHTLSETHDVFQPIVHEFPSSHFRIHEQKIPRAPHRYSGRTAVDSDLTIHEPMPPHDANSPLAFSMEGTPLQPPPSVNPFFWSPGWNSIQAVNKFQSEVGGPLREGPAGVRLLTTTVNSDVSFFEHIPSEFEPRENQWWIFPISQIFGSEELSIKSPAMAERQSSPFLTLNADDAERRALKTGDAVQIVLHDVSYTVPIQLETVLPNGVAGLACVPPLLNGILPGWGYLKIVKHV